MNTSTHSFGHVLSRAVTAVVLIGMAKMTNSDAFALRAFRMDAKRNQFLNYEAVTFPQSPFNGGDTALRRAAIIGIAEDTISLYGVDILNREGDILQTFGVTGNAFKYLRRTLKLRRER